MATFQKPKKTIFNEERLLALRNLAREHQFANAESIQYGEYSADWAFAFERVQIPSGILGLGTVPEERRVIVCHRLGRFSTIHASRKEANGFAAAESKRIQEAGTMPDSPFPFEIDEEEVINQARWKMTHGCNYPNENGSVVWLGYDMNGNSTVDVRDGEGCRDGSALCVGDRVSCMGHYNGTISSISAPFRKSKEVGYIDEEANYNGFVVTGKEMFTYRRVHLANLRPASRSQVD